MDCWLEITRRFNRRLLTHFASFNGDIFLPKTSVSSQISFRLAFVIFYNYRFEFAVDVFYNIFNHRFSIC